MSLFAQLIPWVRTCDPHVIEGFFVHHSMCLKVDYVMVLISLSVSDRENLVSQKF